MTLLDSIRSLVPLWIIEIENGLVADDKLRSPARQARPCTGIATCHVPRRGDEVQFVDKRARRQPHDDVDLLRVDSDLTRSSRTRQANLRRIVWADDGCIQVAVSIDLRAAQQGYLDQPAL